MEWKSWVKRYGIHIVVCIGAYVVAFGINQKVNLDRSHQYVVSETTNVLNDITEFSEDGNDFVFKGWCFAPDYYSEEAVRCELILQDTRTNEAVWAEMEKEPEIQEIEERYAGSGEYSKGSFSGRVNISKLQEKQAYELLVRYTSEYIEDAGEKKEYVQTVSLDKFLCQGKLTEYNPDTFVEPEIAGTGLEKEMEGARLFHYFEEGLWVYINYGKLYYILDGASFPLDQYPNGYVTVNWVATNIKRAPEEYQQYASGNSDFIFMDRYSPELSFGKYLVAIIEEPPKYTTFLGTGFYDNDSGAWIYGVSKELRED